MPTAPGVSPAGNRWQAGLVTALQQLDVPVTVLSHLTDPLWPRGHLRVKSEISSLPHGVSGRLLDYWNIPFLRERSLYSSHRIALDRMAGLADPRTVLITYNASPSYTSVGLYGKRRLGIPWICVVADGAAPGDADGCVFLPWSSYQEWQKGPKLHIDGGVSQVRFGSAHTTPRLNNQMPAVMYAGAMTKHGGADLLVRAFQTLPALRAELWLCGNGSSPVVDGICATDHRIKRWGFVPEERLQGYCREAAVFVNPRPSDLACNKKNFPSKVLEYLSYGKPVISTWTAGLSPEYRDVLVVLEEETPKCLAATIERVLGWNSQQREAMQEKISKFLSSHLWSFQANRLNRWLSELQQHRQR